MAGARKWILAQLASHLARPGMAERRLTPLSNLGLEAVTTRVAYAAARSGSLTYFEPVAMLPGFGRALARTLSELRLAGIRAQELAARGPAQADLARLLEGYEEEFQSRRLADFASMLELAAAAAAEGTAETGLPLLLLDVRLETWAHREFFRVLEKASIEVLIAASPGVAQFFEEPAEDLDSGSPSSAIEHLQRYVFAKAPEACANRDGFEMFSAPGEGLEMAEVARRVLKLASQGVAFDQIAILLRNPERYQPTVEDALRRARIPAHFSRGIARPDPAGRAFLVLLKCAAEDLSASSFAEYLSFGQVPASGGQASVADRQVTDQPEWVGPVDEMLSREEPAAAAPPAPERPLHAPAGWEKLLVDAAVIGGRDRWARRLKGLEQEFQLRLEESDDETQRAHLQRQIQRLTMLAEFALPLITRLDELPKLANWSEWLEALAPLARAALRSPDGVLEALAEFEPMGEVGPVGVEEVAQVLSERLRFLRREPPGRRWGQVFVGSIEEARGCEFRVVFLPGLAEGLFPQRTLEDPLLLDAARQDLSRDTTKDLPQRSHRNLEEREKLCLAVAAARERFIASYPRMDAAEARARVPSFYALELPRALEGALPKLKEFEKYTREAAPARLSWPAPKTAVEAIDDAEYDLARLAGKTGARYLMEANAHLARSLRTRWYRWQPAWKAADGLITADAPALAALSEQRLRSRAWSASALEQFAACPYKFALHGIFRLKAREDAAALEELDPLTRGALFHEVQFELLNQLKDAGVLPLQAQALDAAAAALDRTLDGVAKRYKEELAPAVERVWTSGIEDLRTDLRGWLQQMAQNDGDWEPIHFEYGFGLPARGGRDAESTEAAAELAEGVILRGSIDLVEKHIRSGMLRVTDHKTGKPPEKVPAYTGGGKVLQPMLYALAAEKLLGGTVEMGRLFYATQRGEYRQIGINVNARSRAFLAKLLQNVDSSIEGGFLPPVPEKDACGMCDYRPVCGPYEEQRCGRTKHRQDERLEGLHEIRGFL